MDNFDEWITDEYGEGEEDYPDEFILAKKAWNAGIERLSEELPKTVQDSEDLASGYNVEALAEKVQTDVNE